MGAISIKFAGIPVMAVAIEVRATGGAFRIGEGAGFALSGAARDLSVTGDAIRFGPIGWSNAAQINADLTVELRAEADGDPVVEIGIDRGMFGHLQAAFEASGQQLGAQIGNAFGQVPAFLAFGGQPPEGLPMPFGTGAAIPGMMPGGAPAVPLVEESVTVEWPTAAGRRSEKAAIGVPLKLEGFAG